MAAAAIERLLGRETLADELVTWHGGRATTVILAAGGCARGRRDGRAHAEGSGRACRVESLQAAQFRHGPLELAGPDLAAMVIATEPETRDLDLALAAELRGLGAAVLVDRPTARRPRVGRIDVGPIDRLLAPAASIVPRSCSRGGSPILARARAGRVRPRREGDDP